MGEVEAYRFARWPRVSRREAALGKWLSRALPAVPLAAIERALGALVGDEVRCRVHPPRPAAGASPPRSAFALTLPEEPQVPPFRLALDPALGALLVDRVLGGTGDAVPAHLPAPLADAELGILAYLGARVLTEVTDGALLLSLDAPEAPPADGAHARVPITVDVGSRRGRAELWAFPELLAWQRPAPPAPGRLGTLAALELDLVLDVGRGRLSAAALRASRRGDVFVPDELWDSARPRAPRVLRGRLLGAHRTDFWLAADGESLRVERIERSLSSPTQEASTMMTTSTLTTLELAGDAPIELAIEIARVRLPLEELARLRVGEVLTTGRAVGEVVTLRAGDKALAVGELVEVEGEVGVRLLRTLTHGDASG